MKQRYGPWALVAGASEGIGAAFAHALASEGLKLVLVARRSEPLQKLAAALPVETRCLSVDLGAPDFLEPLTRGTDDLEIGLVVANAALSRVAPFFSLEIDVLLRQIDVNCRAPVLLAHAFGKKMVARGRGGLLFMSSLSGVFGGPYVATYAATKAFSMLLAESLWAELGPLGIDVSTCVAGPTLTPTFLASQPTSFPKPMTAQAVAAAALAGLGRRPRVIPGVGNRMARLFLSWLPRRTVLRLVGEQTKRYGTPELK